MEPENTTHIVSRRRGEPAEPAQSNIPPNLKRTTLPSTGIRAADLNEKISNYNVAQKSALETVNPSAHEIYRRRLGAIPTSIIATATNALISQPLVRLLIPDSTGDLLSSVYSAAILYTVFWGVYFGLRKPIGHIVGALFGEKFIQPRNRAGDDQLTKKEKTKGILFFAGASDVVFNATFIPITWWLAKQGVSIGTAAFVFQVGFSCIWLPLLPLWEECAMESFPRWLRSSKQERH